MLASLLYIYMVGLCGISSIAPSSRALSFARAAGGDVHSLFISYEGSTLDHDSQNLHDRAEPLHNEDPSEVADGIVSDVLPYAAPSRKLLHGCHGRKCDATSTVVTKE